MKKLYKKVNKAIALAISSVLLLMSSAQAAEGTADFLQSDSFNNAADIAANTLREITDNIRNEIKPIKLQPEKIDRAELARTKSEWEVEDIYAMYKQGYDMKDIGMAMKLAASLNERPYKLLEKKGKPAYNVHEVKTGTGADTAIVQAQMSNDTDEKSKIFEAEETAMPEYALEKQEKSWDTVVAEIRGYEAAADADMQIIKENGLIDFIDPSVLTADELEYLNDDTKTEDQAAALAVSGSNSTDDEILDVYNNFVFPTSRYSQYNEGISSVNNDEIEINEITKNATVRATDLSLKGRNGLDLNLTRVNSLINTGTRTPIAHLTYAGTTTVTKHYYSVTGYADVEVKYREPLPNGSYTESFDSMQIMFKPRVYNAGAATSYDIASRKALLYDRALLAENRMPKNMFESLSAANDTAAQARDGKYNKTYTFSNNSKVQYIKFIVMDDEDITHTNDEGIHTVRQGTNGADIYCTSGYDHNLTDKYFDIGIGWEFDFPYIERLYGNTSGERGNAEYLHFGAKGIWRIDEDNKLDGYYLNDLVLSKGGTFNNQSCWYTLTEKNGKKYYFGTLGQLYGIEDRFGNNIKFEYNTVRLYDGHNYPYQLKKITDSVGREIIFDYTNPLQTTVTVTDKNSSEQSRVIKYNKTLEDSAGEDYVLSSVIDAENNETVYTYETSDLKASLTSKTFDNNDYEDIKHYYIWEIFKPSGSKIRLNTVTVLCNCGNDGIANTLTANSKYIYEPKESNPELYSRCYIKIYSRVGTVSYDGYPRFRNPDEIPPEIKIGSFTNEYYRDGDEKRVLKEYSKSSKNNWLCETETTYRDDFETETCIWRDRVEYTYNSNEQCIKEIHKKYNVPTNQSQYQSIATEYTYDSGNYNDLLKIRRFGDENYTISYLYDDTYHIPTKKTYKKDADTTIIENYTLTTDKKAVAAIAATENNSTKRKREYVYDSYGNVIKEKRYTGNNNWNEFIQLGYSYDDMSDNTYKINGADLSRIFITGVKDADGNLVAALPGGTAGTIEYKYLYDWYGNVISETDTNGNVFTYSYDKLNRPIVSANPAQGSIQIAYGLGALNNYVQITNENGNIMKYSYFSNGDIKEEKDVTANSVLKSYNYTYHINSEGSYLNKKEITNYSNSGNTSITDVITDAIGNLIELNIKNSAGDTVYREEYEYSYAVDNLYDCVTKTIKGETADKDYTVKTYVDKHGNAVKEETIYKNGAEDEALVTEYTYDCLGNVKAVKSPRAAAENWTGNVYTAQYEYDIDGQVTKTTDIYGNYTINEYDGLGRLVRSADAEATAAAAPYYSTFTYDALGRMLKSETPIESGMYAETKNYYDNNGNIIRTMTKNGTNTYSTTDTAYNWRNSPVKVLTDGTDSAYCYDAAGNVLRMYTGELTNFTISGLDNVSGADYEVTKYTYDSQSRVISTTDALGNTSYNTYDINGSLVKTVDRNNNIINYVYDALKNLTEKSTQENAEDTKQDIYSYTYNRMGLPLTMSGGGVNAQYIYDNLGRPVREDLTNGISKVYNYDSNNNRVLFRLLKDNVQQINTVYTYDKLDRVLTSTNGADITSYAYDKNGRIKNETAVGYETEYTYNIGGLVTDLTTEKSGTTIQAHSYTYYPNGNISGKQSTVGTQTNQYTYLYDNAGRLTSEQNGTDTKSYTYDSFGNRAGMTVSGAENYTESYTYDSNNRLMKRSRLQNTTEEIRNYSYDNNGNQISWYKSVLSAQDGDISLSMETDGTDYALYGYDMYNRLKTYTNGVDTASYTYDGSNLRQSKTVNGVTTRHIWDGSNVVMDETGAKVNKYYRGANGITHASLNGTVSYYQRDAHGDVTALTDSTGVITKSYLYDAFGVEQNASSTDNNPFRYCGEYFDDETDLIYLRNRYYNSSIGRFVSEDPIRSGINWYVYCENNPVTMTDPFGLGPDVMIRYIIEKNKGSVAFDSSTGVTTIKMRGYKDVKLSAISDGQITVSVEGQADFKIKANNINGRTVVDSQILIDNFALSISDAMHQAGDEFKSVDDAAIAWGLSYNKASIDDNKEYISVIYESWGDYEYTAFKKGDGASASVPSTPFTKKLHAVIHSHAAYDARYDNENFSSADKAVAKEKGVPIYVVTPAGYLKSYEPNEEITTIIGNCFPRDPQNP